MSKQLKIVSWNIAGARKVQSMGHFDYEEHEDIAYFADELRKLSPDVVCFQESHIKPGYSVTRDIAQRLEFAYVYDAVASPSHIDSQYQLGCSVIARFELTPEEMIVYPRPDFPLYLAGKQIEGHDKIVQLLSYGGLMIANTQMLPVSIFGTTYDAGNGAQLAKAIEAVLLQKLKTPLLFCGDFNYDTELMAVYPALYSQFGLAEALPDVTTYPNKQNIKLKPDHILYSPGVRLVDAKVVATQADHHLCFAEFTID